MADKKHYEELKEKINYHMNLYYNEDTPEISDYEYDMLMSELKRIEAENPSWISADSPTQKIGGTTKHEAGEKIKHNVPMLSIEDVFNKDDVIKWVKEVKEMHPGVKFSVEEKIDGLSMSLRYRDGLLIMAETRGDGLIGEDVTKNALAIEDVPKHINVPGYLEVRGEVYMNHDNFKKFNEAQEDKKQAANPRNLAAGTLRQLDSKIVEERGLSFFVFNIQDESGTDTDIIKSHTRGLDFLSGIGFNTVNHILCETEEEILKAIEDIGESRGTLNYDIDGAVVKIDQTEYRKDFPAGSKYSAGHIAYKYPPEEKEVIIEKIDVNVGRTGKMTFRAIFKEPVRLCGTSVQKATLHNIDFIKNMGISEGCTAICRKQGDIIPAIIKVVKKADKEYKEPQVCPVCGSRLVKEKDTCDIYCENPSCPAQLKRTVAYFAGKDAMDIKNFGEKYIEALIDEGYIKNIRDIYSLKNHRDELIKKGILGKEKNTDRILNAIEDSKQNDAYKLLTGLAIKNVGKVLAKEIIREYESLWDLIAVIVTSADNIKKDKDAEDVLLFMPNVGKVTADALRNYFYNEENLEMLHGMCYDDGVNFENSLSEFPPQDRRLDGVTIVVTGTLANFGRKEITDFIENHGGKCTGSVSKKTDYLVAGENAGSKLNKAKELGIKIITEEELLKLAK